MDGKDDPAPTPSSVPAMVGKRAKAMEPPRDAPPRHLLESRRSTSFIEGVADRHTDRHTEDAAAAAAAAAAAITPVQQAAREAEHALASLDDEWSPVRRAVARRKSLPTVMFHLQYLGHRQRAALFFAPTKTVQHQAEVWEVPFDVQEEKVGPFETVLYAPAKPRRIERRIVKVGSGGGGGGGGSGGQSGGDPVTFESGHSATLQLAGYRWIEGVPADTLGKASFELTSSKLASEGPSTHGPPPFRCFNSLEELPPSAGFGSGPGSGPGLGLGRASDDTAGSAAAAAAYKGPPQEDWRKRNMRRLVCDTVRSANGGREVTLRSCFRLRNSTGHVILVAKAPDPRKAHHGTRFIDIANYDQATGQARRRRGRQTGVGWGQWPGGQELGRAEGSATPGGGGGSGVGESKDGGVPDVSMHYEVVQPGADYFVPLTEVATTQLFLGGYRPDTARYGERRRYHEAGQSGSAASTEAAAKRPHAAATTGGGSGDGIGVGSDGGAGNGVSRKVMVERARFAAKAIPLANLVVEANEALAWAKKKNEPPPSSGLQLSFPLSFEAEQTWAPRSRFYRAQVHRTAIDRDAGGTDGAGDQRGGAAAGGRGGGDAGGDGGGGDDGGQHGKHRSKHGRRHTMRGVSKVKATAATPLGIVPEGGVLRMPDLGVSASFASDGGTSANGTAAAAADNCDDGTPEERPSEISSDDRLRRRRRRRRRKVFVSALTFEGPRKGYVFKAGNEGTGYYLDSAHHHPPPPPRSVDGNDDSDEESAGIGVQGPPRPGMVRRLSGTMKSWNMPPSPMGGKKSFFPPSPMGGKKSFSDATPKTPLTPTDAASTSSTASSPTRKAPTRQPSTVPEGDEGDYKDDDDEENDDDDNASGHVRRGARRFHSGRSDVSDDGAGSFTEEEEYGSDSSGSFESGGSSDDDWFEEEDSDDESSYSDSVSEHNERGSEASDDSSLDSSIPLRAAYRSEATRDANTAEAGPHTGERGDGAAAEASVLSSGHHIGASQQQRPPKAGGLTGAAAGEALHGIKFREREATKSGVSKQERRMLRERRSHQILSCAHPLPLDHSTLQRNDHLTKRNEDGTFRYRPGAIDYVIELHPPIVIENLLPHLAVFELMNSDNADTGGTLSEFAKIAVDTVQDAFNEALGGERHYGGGSGYSGYSGSKRMVWCGELAHGDEVPIHSVGLDSELKLLINLGWCRSSGEGALVHVPSRAEASGRKGHEENVFGLGGDKKKELEEHVTLTDRMGQKTVIHIKNKLMPAGNRHLTVYCPYWLVNLTHYSLLFKQDAKGDKQLPAGSLSHIFDESVADARWQAKVAGKRKTATRGGGWGGDGGEGVASVDDDGESLGSGAARMANAAEKESAAVGRRSGSVRQRVFQAAAELKAKLSGGAGERGREAVGGVGGGYGGGDGGEHVVSGQDGLAWRRDKYRGAFPGAVPLLHDLFRSEAAAGKRGERLHASAAAAAAAAVAAAEAEARAKEATPGPPVTYPTSPTAAPGTPPAAAVAAQAGAAAGAGATPASSVAPPPFAAPHATNGHKGHSRKAAGPGQRGLGGVGGLSETWRDPGNLTHFLEESVGGLTDLKLSQVVALAFMFSWADVKQR